MNYPINDLDWHEAKLRAMDNDDPPCPELVRYHLTAICMLKLGEAYDIDGPAMEVRVDGGVSVRKVLDYLVREPGPNGVVFCPVLLRKEQ